MNQNIKRYRYRVEKLLGKGSYKSWTDREYKLISTLIQEKTLIRISPDTLKRLFGKTRYKDGHISPQTSTLNALAQFIGYKDWYNYERRHKRMTRRIIYFFMVFCGFVFLLFAGYFIHKQTLRSKETTDIFFEPEKFVFEVPYNVSFFYSVDETQDLHVNFFTPKNKEYLLHKEDSQICNLYTIPGIHPVRITDKGDFLKEFTVVGTTPIPSTYISSRRGRFLWDYEMSDSLFWFPPEKIYDELGQEIQEYWSEFEWYYEYGISLNSFYFSVEVENNETTGGIPFYDVAIKLFGRDKGIIVPLVDEGGQIYVTFQAGEYKEVGRYSANKDLFETDMGIPYFITIKMDGECLKIMRNNKVVFASDSLEMKGDLYAIKISGKGSMKMQNLTLRSLDSSIVHEMYETY